MENRAKVLGARIVAARERMGWTQIDVAYEIDVDPMTVSRWERGVTTPRSSALLALADALGCTTDYLLGRSD